MRRLLSVFGCPRLRPIPHARIAAGLAVTVAVAGAADAAPARAQAGVAVAVSAAGEPLVLRATSGRGRAAILVFSRGDSGWARSASLEPGPGTDPYEGFGASLSAAGDLVAAAGGDADARIGARLYRRTDAGGWEALGATPTSPDAARPESGPARLDMAGLMRIMDPPARAVALSPDGGALALWSAGSEAGVVRVLRRAGASWEPSATIPLGDSVPPAAVRLAFADGRLAVGLPGAAPAGAVRVFGRDAGGWRLEAEFRPESAATAGFGAAVALDGDRLAVGIPGAGRVAVYARRGDGWEADGVLSAPAPGSFGAVVAWTDDALWVGAPDASGGRGAVHRYVATTTGWRHDGRFAPADEVHPGSPLGLGYALAARGDVVVAGAPAAGGGAGGAAVLERRGGAWHGPEWLETGVAVETVAGGQVRCVDGRAAGFDCGNVDLLAFLNLASLGAGPEERVTDIWGWADPETGREYALVGRNAGMAVVDVTRPESPVFVALVRGRPAGLRDIKVYRDHAFFVGDGAGPHGLLVFDLRRLRALAGEEPAVLEPDARYGGIGSAHNLVMDTATGLAVPVGASGAGQTCGGGLHMVDVSTPTAPKFAGCYTDTTGLIAPGRTHDAQCLVYRGPDRAHQGRRICLASNETALRIVDVTDPARPVEIASASYPGVAYTHQGWLTEDHRYFFMNDELDELVGLTDRTRTLIWDVVDLDDPVMVGEHLGPDIATDHNLFIRGDRMYQANYQAGLRVVDISDPERPRDVGFFDTTPYGPNHAGFGGGAWTAYPFLPSGTILVSSMHEGLFLLRPRPEPVP